MTKATPDPIATELLAKLSAYADSVTPPHYGAITIAASPIGLVMFASNISLKHVLVVLRHVIRDIERSPESILKVNGPEDIHKIDKEPS